MQGNLLRTLEVVKEGEQGKLSDDSRCWWPPESLRPSRRPFSRPQRLKSYGFRQRAVIELKGMQQEIVSLAQAMPAEKYTWRPADNF